MMYYSAGVNDWGVNTITVSDTARDCPNYVYGPYQLPSVQIREEERNMRGLFHVWAVDSRDDTVLDLGMYVAENADKAKLKGATGHLHHSVSRPNDDLDDYDFVVVKLGDVRAKKDIQEVRIAK